MRWRATGWVAVRCVLASLCCVATMFPSGVMAAGEPVWGEAFSAGLVAEKLDPALALWLQAGVGSSTSRAVPGGEVQVVASPTGELRVKVLACTSGVVGESLGGVPVSYAAGSVASLVVSRAELAQVTADARVEFVEPSWQTRPALDVSVRAIGADSAHAALPPILGEGVIVGVVDTGIDYRHLDFRYDADRDGKEEASRVLSLLDQTWGLFGATYRREEIEGDLASGAAPGAGTVKQVDRDGHGTHVASIAAGDGSSSPGGFRGVAPEAWIVAVKTTFFTADILEAVGFIFDEADRRGLPAVVNLSLGGQQGPHDGTSAFERGLDELAEGPGRAVVVSAGNEGAMTVHVSARLQGGMRSFELESGGREVTMEMWYPGSSRFTIGMVAPSGAALSAAAGSGSGFVTTPDGVAYIDNSIGGPNPQNGDREALIRITNTTAGTRWRVMVSDDGGGGRFDGWITTDAGRVVGGDSSSTIDEPGNARAVITVGSWNSKAVWLSTLGEQDDSDEVEVGALSSFSSQGPTRDGRTKPDLAAPGAWICGALSSSASAFADLTNPDGVHTMHRGTSMAAPHVAGTIALLFDANPHLTSADVLAVLTATAARDAATGSVPNVRWGYGKLDAWAALLEVRTSEPPAPSVGRPTVTVARNPAIDQAVFTYALPEGTRAASLRVYDLAGRRVFEVPVSVSAADYVWDLVSQGGERVAAGLYLYVVASDRGSSDVGRLVIAP